MVLFVMRRSLPLLFAALLVAVLATPIEATATCDGPSYPMALQADRSAILNYLDEELAFAPASPSYIAAIVAAYSVLGADPSNPSLVFGILDSNQDPVEGTWFTGQYHYPTYSMTVMSAYASMIASPPRNLDPFFIPLQTFPGWQVHLYAYEYLPSNPVVLWGGIIGYTHLYVLHERSLPPWIPDLMAFASEPANYLEWRDTNHVRDRMIEVFNILGEPIPNAADVLDTIIAQQNLDGGWGADAASPSNADETSHALLTLIRNFADGSDPRVPAVIASGLAFVASQYVEATTSGLTKAGFQDAASPGLPELSNTLSSLALLVETGNIEGLPNFIFPLGDGWWDVFLAGNPPPMGKDERRCASKLRKFAQAYLKKRLDVMRGCYDAVNDGSIAGPCPDAAAQAAIAAAQSKVSTAKIEQRCPAATISALKFGAGCETATNAADLSSCLIAAVDSSSSRALSVQYAQPGAYIADAGERNCQKMISRTLSRSYLLKAVKASGKCLGKRDKGKYAVCNDLKSRRKINSACSKVENKLAAACSDARVQALDSAGGFGFSCAGASSVAGLADCQVAEHDVAGKMVLDLLP